MGYLKENNPPLGQEVPFGEDTRTKKKKNEDFKNRFTMGFENVTNDNKIMPPKPTQSDRRGIILAKLAGLSIPVRPKRIKRLHDYPMGQEIKDRMERINQIKNKSFQTEGDKRELEDHVSQVKYYTDKYGATPPKPTQADRRRSMEARLQKLAGGYNDVIKSFKEKKPNKSGNYSTDGESFKLFGNEIARHSDSGLQVSNAGYDTQTTYKALIGMGVDVDMTHGETRINKKPYEHGTFVTIPYKELKENPGEDNILDTSRRRDTNENLVKMRSLRNRVMNKVNNLSQTAIQPSDQRTINSITGIKSTIPNTIRATAIHHILYRRNSPELQFNQNNVIPLDRKSHSEAHRFDSLKLRARLESSNREQTRLNHIEEFKSIDKEEEEKNDIKKKLKIAREIIAERKTDIEHKHMFSFYKVAKQLGSKSPELVGEDGSKYWKYWLLNAKQVNGNGWGVVDWTIGQHIGKFVGRPFTITSNEWITNSEYGSVYEHPFLPTNHLPTIFAHQAKFTVGDITRVFKDDNDDYFCIVKPLTRFANRTPPPFCSPGIFQTDPTEKENHLTQWEPLHLAGLDSDPAYGAHVALLRGTCTGTEDACIVQFGARQKVAKQLGAYKTEPFKPTRNFRGFNDALELKPKSQASISATRARRERMGYPVKITDPVQIKQRSDEFKTNTAKIICPVRMKGEIMKMRLAALGDRREFMKDFHGMPGWNDFLENEGIKPKKIRPPKPIDEDFQKIISAKLAALRSETNKSTNRVNVLGMKKKRVKYGKLHAGTDEVLKHFSPHTTKSNYASTMIDTNGNIIQGMGTHYGMVAELGHLVGMKQKTDSIGGKFTDDEDVHEFLKRTGMIRLQHFPQIDRMAVHVAAPTTNAQMKTIRELTQNAPNRDFGFAIGGDYDNLITGEGNGEMGFRNFLALHRKQFQMGAKLASAEEDDNYNMTYMSSKRVKLKKKLTKIAYRFNTPDDIISRGQTNMKKQKDEIFPIEKNERAYFDEAHTTNIPRTRVQTHSRYPRGAPSKTSPGKESLEPINTEYGNEPDNESDLGRHLEDVRMERKQREETGGDESFHEYFRRKFGPNKISGGIKDQATISLENARKLAKSIKTARLRLMFAAVPLHKVNKPQPVRINPEHGRIIADSYDQMKHDPNNPEVKSSYDALIKETSNQFKDLLGKGFKISQNQLGKENEYNTAEDMHRDIDQNNHLSYFPTERGFGAEGGVEHKDHPMLQQTEFKHEGKPLLANDLFRIVHDVNGHHAGGRLGFSPMEEHQAYLQHKTMYSPLANKALFTETVGQNSHQNFSRTTGEHNTNNPKDTIFSEQKAGLIPEHIINGKFHI